MVYSTTSTTKQNNSSKKIHQSIIGRMSENTIESIDKEIAYVKFHLAVSLRNPFAPLSTAALTFEASHNRFLLYLSLRSKLELERTINSMSLAAEREILKKIHKLNISRRQLLEKKQHDQQIKQQKAAVSTLRGSLKEKRTDISELKVELSTVQTAVALGCEVKDLLGKKIDCPTDKIGTILGKKGRNIQEIMSTNKVDVQIDKDQGDIHLIGASLESLDTVVAKLEAAMTKIEKYIEVSSLLHYYLTSANITLMSKLRKLHPNTNIDMKRVKGEDGKNSTEKANPQSNNRIRNIRVHGNPADIAAFEEDLLNVECITETVTVSSRTSGLLVGKSGKSIEEMVNTYQVVVDIERPNKAHTLANGSALVASNEESTNVKICGPPANVAAVLAIINNLVEENRDHEEVIHLDAIVKVVLLQNSGAGIQALQKNANAEAKQNVEGTTSNSILVNIKGKDLVVKGKSKAVKYVMPFVHKEIERVSSMINRMNIDIFAIPAVIGKGGQGIKMLLEGTKSVHMEIHSKLGEVEICGLEQNEVDKVTCATKALIDTNQVQRLRLECDDTSTTNSFTIQFRNLTRSVTMKQIKEMVVLSADYDSKELALRGTPENLIQASKLVQDFLDSNFMEELVVSSEDVTALLTGGKTSKIAEFASYCNVNLSVDKERNTVVAKGEKLKVVNAVKTIREFLYGSANVAVLNIVLTDKDAMGVLIGKSGKAMAALQSKFPSVSVIIHRTDAAITLRGDSHEVQQCHTDIMTRLSTANITRNVELTKEKITDAITIKYIKRLGSLASVKVELDSEKGNVSFRGSRADVYGAITLLKEHLTGLYECQWYIGNSFFKKIFDVCIKSTHLSRINQESGAKIYLDEKFEVIVISGTKEQVKVAKKGMLTFCDFVFGESMSKFDIPAAAFPMMGKSSFINEVITASSATVIADKDLNTIVMFSTNKEKLDEASTILKEKLDAVEKLIFVWQFSETEEWLLSLIIGKKGENVQKLRKDTNCTIEVNSEERRMIVSADDVVVVTKGKEAIDTFVVKARKEYAVIYFSSVDLPAFIGKSGNNMKSFMEKHGVKIELIKKGDEGMIRITGDEEQVTAAKEGVNEWKISRIERRKDAEGEITKQIKLKNIPVIIGTKGETIRALQREFGCKVNIDRDTLTYKVTGGTSEKRNAICEKLENIITENEAGKRMAGPLPVEYVGEVVEVTEEAVVNIVEQMD